ncbi:O-succinylbenzoic acid--CoA ligase, partial [Xanthomonas citri pv. citri]|nr:O-succinylbenzoic acid--CoA ligase [Xanthomonas citri pv. citri]
MPELVPFPVDRADITGYYEALAAALDGSGPALAPYEAGTPEPEFDAAALAAAPDDLALVVATSGST